MPIYIQTDSDGALIEAMSLVNNTGLVTGATTCPIMDNDESIVRAQDSVTAYEGEGGLPWDTEPVIEDNDLSTDLHLSDAMKTIRAYEDELEKETQEVFRERIVRNYNKELSEKTEPEKAKSSLIHLGKLITEEFHGPSDVLYIEKTAEVISLRAFMALGHPKE